MNKGSKLLQAAENDWINYDGGNDRKLYGYFIDGFGMGYGLSRFIGIPKTIWHHLENDKPKPNQLVLGANLFSEMMMSVYYDAVHGRFMLYDTSFPEMPNMEMGFTHWAEIPKAPIVANSSKTCKK